MAEPETLPGSPSPFTRWGVMLLFLGWAWQVGAIWWQTWTPLVDWPDHAARHYLESLSLTGRELPAGYAVRYRLLPNLGGDLVVPALMTFLPPLTACKVFLTLAVLLYWVGPALFLRQYAGAGPSALFAALLLLPLAFSSQFLWGFLNYYSGFGLAFLALAHHGWMMDRKRPGAAQLLLHTLLVALLFLWHLGPWAVYGVVMGCRVLADAVGRLRREGRFLRQAGRALLLVLPSVPSLGMMAAYAAASAKPEGPANWGGWMRKLTMPPTLFRSYDARADAVVVVLWLAAILAGFGLPRAGQVRGKWVFLALAVLAGLYLYLPFQGRGTSDADSRLLPAMLVCAAACLATLPLRRPRLAAVLLGTCLLVRGGSILAAWQRLGGQLDAAAGAFAHVEPGSRVVPAFLVPEAAKEYPGIHFAAWAVPLRGAFDPTLFHLADQQTLRIDSPCSEHSVLHPASGGYEVSGDEVRACADYLWVYNPAGEEVRVPPSFPRVFEGGGVTLWRVR